MIVGCFALIAIFFTARCQPQQPEPTLAAHLSEANECVMSFEREYGVNHFAKVTGRSLGGIVGYGWDGLQSATTRPVVKTEYKNCQMDPTAIYLIPDGVVVKPIFYTTVDKMAKLYSNYNDFKLSIGGGLAAGAKAAIPGFGGLSGSFSASAQAVRNNFKKYESRMLQTQLVYRAFSLQQTSINNLHPEFHKRIQRIITALNKNLTTKARYLAELIIRDYGTHYIVSAEVGAIIESRSYIQNTGSSTNDSLSADLRLAAGLNFQGLIDVSGHIEIGAKIESQSVLEQMTRHSEIITLGGPDVNSVMMLLKHNLTVGSFVCLVNVGANFASAYTRTRY